MSTDKGHGQGDKTHEEFLRKLERKDDLRKPGEPMPDTAASPPVRNAEARDSEFPVSREGMNQETRGQNKHNNSGQAGHGPQKHSPAEEKH
jgi:hypothetical protein